MTQACPGTTPSRPWRQALWGLFSHPNRNPVISGTLAHRLPPLTLSTIDLTDSPDSSRRINHTLSEKPWPLSLFVTDLLHNKQGGYSITSPDAPTSLSQPTTAIIDSLCSQFRQLIPSRTNTDNQPPSCFPSCRPRRVLQPQDPTHDSIATLQRYLNTNKGDNRIIPLIKEIQDYLSTLKSLPPDKQATLLAVFPTNNQDDYQCIGGTRLRLQTALMQTKSFSEQLVDSIAERLYINLSEDVPEINKAHIKSYILSLLGIPKDLIHDDDTRSAVDQISATKLALLLLTVDELAKKEFLARMESLSILIQEVIASKFADDPCEKLNAYLTNLGLENVSKDLYMANHEKYNSAVINDHGNTPDPKMNQKAIEDAIMTHFPVEKETSAPSSESSSSEVVCPSYDEIANHFSSSSDDFEGTPLDRLFSALDSENQHVQKQAIILLHVLGANYNHILEKETKSFAKRAFTSLPEKLSIRDTDGAYESETLHVLSSKFRENPRDNPMILYLIDSIKVDLHRIYTEISS